MKSVIITVGSITNAQKCRKMLSQKGIRAKLVKLDSSNEGHGCSNGLEIKTVDLYSAASVLRREGVEYGIREYEGNDLS